jgi:hypothetical protein
VDLVVLIGIPATGKTSYYASELLRSHLRVSRDLLGTRHRETALFSEALRTGTRVVVDNTNVTRAERARFIVPARAAGYTVRGFFFESRGDDATARGIRETGCPTSRSATRAVGSSFPLAARGSTRSSSFVSTARMGSWWRSGSTKFDDLDARMRQFETIHDQRVLPGLFAVARIDGRSFTRLTKELHQFDAPFDERFRDLMLAATRRVMDCGFRAVYGYTQSDEISLLLHRDEDSFAASCGS